MQSALEEARQAGLRGDVPIGAIVVTASGEVIAAAGNEVEQRRDPTAHAEMLAIRSAAEKLGSKWLEGCDLYVTLEPCAMCAQAISLARLRRLYYGAADPKGGGVAHGGKVFSHPTCHHAPEIISGLMEEPCAQLLKDFFASKRV